ncbi:MAG TPA: hypothetical protein VES73_17310 [Lamprocystis sp. (in: g-proteobacteria)]|nr:hypothetical protein [Lamprocystis sp. (in: g-proteobacteria)]
MRQTRGHGGAVGRWLVGAALPVMLAGCATSPDPHQGGFGSGIVGLAGGGYQQRVDERQGTYQGEMDAGLRLKAQARELEQERDAVKGDLRQANARLAALEQRLAQQRAALKAQGAAANSAEARRLNQAQARVTSTKGALRKIRPEDQSVPDLKARAQAVQRDLNDIDSMVATVGGKGF